MATKRKKALTAEEIEHVSLIEKVSLKVYARTIKQLEKYYGKPEVESEVKKEYKKYQPIIDSFANGEWGCQEDSVKELVSSLVLVLAGVDLSEHLNSCYGYSDEIIDDDDWLAGIVLVPIKNTNSHDYPLEQPVMIRNNRHTENCYAMDNNEEHNCLNDKINTLRLPTLDEVKMIVTKHFDEIVTQFVIV